MKRALAGFGVAVVMMLAACVPGTAQDAGPQLMLRMAGGQTVFRIGERIPLELVFTGPGGGRYQVDSGPAGRVPGFASATVMVSPGSGWADPLKIDVESSGGFGGSWGSSSAPLSGKPIVVPMDLNEWVRFDQPGNYQVVVTSGVVDRLARRAGLIQNDSLTLQSNPMEIKIVPATAAWQKAKLAEIEAALAKPVKKNYAPSPGQRDAMADLRALGTAGAAAVMAKHLREDDGLMYECSYGLMGLPEAVRPAALADLNAEMDDPNFPISGWFLDTMAVLQISDGEPAAMRAQRQQLTDQAWQAAFESLDSKQGKARAATVDTLLNFGHKEETPQQRTEMGRILAASLPDLSPQRQAGALENNWDLIHPNVTVVELQAMAEIPLKSPESMAVNDYEKRDAKSAALRRWYEVDPTGAQQEILREIGTVNPELTAQSLAFLPKEKLPRFEYMWAQQFVATDDALFAGLLAKFGEGGAVSLVEAKASTEIGKWACDPQDAALAYIAEFDSDNALHLIEQALKARGQGETGCYRMMFQDIARYTHVPVVTKAAIEAVNDPDQQTAEDALIYLTEYDDASAKEAILSRYAAWSAQWRGRADELEARSTGEGSPFAQDHGQDIGLGRNLVRALLANQGWMATPDLIAHVRAECVGEQVCLDAKQIPEPLRKEPYWVNADFQANTFQVAQYQVQSLELLDAKVTQFPRGTRFVLMVLSGNDSHRRGSVDKVKAIFAKHGMLLQTPGG